MEWEEHSLEACLAVLGLEAWDMTEPMSVDRLEDEEDWLDGWMKTDEGKRILEEPTKMNGEMEDIAWKWSQERWMTVPWSRSQERLIT